VSTAEVSLEPIALLEIVSLLTDVAKDQPTLDRRLAAASMQRIPRP